MSESEPAINSFFKYTDDHQVIIPAGFRHEIEQNVQRALVETILKALPHTESIGLLFKKRRMNYRAELNISAPEEFIIEGNTSTDLFFGCRATFKGTMAQGITDADIAINRAFLPNSQIHAIKLNIKNRKDYSLERTFTITHYNQQDGKMYQVQVIQSPDVSTEVKFLTGIDRVPVPTPEFSLMFPHGTDITSIITTAEQMLLS